MATCRVSLSAQELIGLPQYSNVTIGPAFIEREVEDTKEDRAAAFAEMGNEIRGVLGEQRRIVLEAVKAFAQSGGYQDVRNQK